MLKPFYIATLLLNHHVKSLNVAGEGEDTVFVLQLSTSQHDQEAAITVTTGQWRNKSAAHIRPDIRRAEQRAEQRRAHVGIDSCIEMPDFQSDSLKDLAPVSTITNGNKADLSTVISDNIPRKST